MTITTASIHDPIPVGALRGALQANGSVLWYMPGDTLPPDPPAGTPIYTATRNQFICALNQAAYYTAFVAAVNARPVQDRIYWANVQSVSSADAELLAIAAALGVSAAQLVAAFNAAKTFPA